MSRYYIQSLDRTSPVSILRASKKFKWQNQPDWIRGRFRTIAGRWMPNANLMIAGRYNFGIWNGSLILTTSACPTGATDTKLTLISFCCCHLLWHRVFSPSSCKNPSPGRGNQRFEPHWKQFKVHSSLLGRAASECDEWVRGSRNIYSVHPAMRYCLCLMFGCQVNQSMSDFSLFLLRILDKNCDKTMKQ